MSPEHTIDGHRFEWNEKKAKRNVNRHGVTFVEAATVFADEMAVLLNDDEHSKGERRYIALGRSNRGRILFVSFTERKSGEVTRIISAREAEANESKAYIEQSS